MFYRTSLRRPWVPFLYVCAMILGRHQLDFKVFAESCGCFTTQTVAKTTLPNFYSNLGFYILSLAQVPMASKPFFPHSTLAVFQSPYKRMLLRQIKLKKEIPSFLDYLNIFHMLAVIFSIIPNQEHQFHKWYVS